MMWLWRWGGVEIDPVSGKEKLVSALGGFFALLTITVICQSCLPTGSGLLLVASMGATAVLVFGVPHGPLSQPWPVLGGHLLSAAIGVACAQLIPQQGLAAGCAVGLSIGAMHQFKCIHPPGGATALTAVIGGPAIAHLGFQFVLCPVFINAAVMVLLAIGLNAPFPWRRYPACLVTSRSRKPPAAISHEAVVAALRQIDSFVDINEDDLCRLVALLTTETTARVERPAGIATRRHSDPQRTAARSQGIV
jgi:CBS domain-containing membrane protein